MTECLSHSGFGYDLKYGKFREQAFWNILVKADVYCKRIECKSDRRAIKTGNVFIEYRQHGRPSGIAITKADYWALEYSKNCWIFLPTMVLKEICKKAYRDKRQRVKGGDNKKFDGILIPLEWLVKLYRC